MEEESKYCENCHRDIPLGNCIIHFSYCEKNIQLCRLCKEPVARNQLGKHLDEAHKLDSCVFCKNVYEIWQIDSHQAECNKKPALCKYCEEKYPFDELSDHESHCGSRTEKCPFCDKYVKLMLKDSHAEICQKNKRQKRMVSCEYCSLELIDEKYEEHILSCGSRTEKCLCGAYVMIKNKRNHESTCKQSNYLKTMVLCEYCELEIPCDKYPDHEIQCSLNWVPCHSCNDFIAFKNMEDHKRDCEKRKGIKQKDACCRYCGDGFETDFLQNHEDNCNSRAEQCYRCYKYIKLKDFDYHRKNCSKDNLKSFNDIRAGADYDDIEYPPEADDVILCSFCKASFPLDCFHEHVETCGERTEKCPICQVNIRFKDKANHEITCKEDNFYQNCPICCERFPSSILEFHYEECFAANSIDFHKELHLNEAHQSNKQELMDWTENAGVTKDTKISNTQLKNCPYCMKAFIERSYDNHIIYCPKALKKCLFCEETFHVKNEKNHVENCPSLEEMEYLKSYRDANKSENISLKDDFYKKNKSKVCPHCDTLIEEKKYKEHTNICLKKIKKCKFCSATFKATNESNHLKKCPKSSQGAPSTDKFLYKGLSAEQTSDNKKKIKGKELENCSNCHNKIPKEELKAHRNDCMKSYQYCQFCFEKYHINKKQEHIKICSKISHSSISDTGAKPKTVFTKICSRVRNLFPGENDNSSCQEQENYGYEIDMNKRNISPRFESQATSSIGTEFQNSQCLQGMDYIPCEFCSKYFPFEEIITHESGCRPDLTAVQPKATESSPFIQMTDESKEKLTKDLINEKQNYSLPKSSTKNQFSDYEAHFGNKTRTEENCSFMEKHNEKYNNYAFLNISNNSIYPTISENVGRKCIMANAEKESLASNIHSNKHKEFSQNSYSDDKNVHTKFGVSKDCYNYSENSNKKYRGNHLDEKYCNENAQQSNQNLCEDVKSLHNEMRNAGIEYLASNIDSKKHNEHSQNSYPDGKNAPTELMSKESYFYLENSNKKYRGENLAEKYYNENTQQGNQTLHEDIKSLHNEMGIAGIECMAANIDGKLHEKHSQNSYSDDKNVPTELVSKESYFYSENSYKKYRGNNLPEKYYNENIPQKNQNLHEHAKSLLEISETPETMNYSRKKELAYLSEDPQTKNIKEIAPYVAHEENIHLKQKYLCNEESKKCINSVKSFEASEPLPFQNLSLVDVTKSDEILDKSKKIKKWEPSSNVSVSQIKKSEIPSPNKKNSSKCNELDKPNKFHSMWQKIDSETIEHLQSNQSFGSCQKPLCESEVNFLQQQVNTSDINHSIVSCTKANDALGKISNVTQNDVKDLKSFSDLELPMTKRKYVIDNFRDKFESHQHSTQNRKLCADFSVDNDDNVEITSSKITELNKKDELILKRKQTQLVDITKKYDPYQDSLKLWNKNFPCNLDNQSLVNRPQKNEFLDFHAVKETKSNFKLASSDSSKTILGKCENYNSSTKPLDQQMNDLSIKYMEERNNEEIEQSGIKDYNLDSYFQFLDSDTSNRHINEICNVCANEMCLCQIKESLDAEGERSQSFLEKSGNRVARDFAY